ncbi:glycerol-3-phosphate 1-O-acyltransferase PlsY [Yoonia sp. BS5-3]|uniref:Glycerol-3-phosphate acyltransferase n=1 Tax=Yoonia phaeophyticola TaxID=3137369 RepID=A0ABZ2V7B3_9RHOB
MTIFGFGLDIIAIWGAIGYLLGSIPSGVILARLMNLGDLRQIGSGNIGATNVLRTGNKTAAALTLIADAAKGAAAVLLARHFSGESALQIAGIAVLLGHCYPVWLRFKGGKGVATYFGVFFGFAWPLGIVASVIWLTTAAISRYSSAAALITAGWLPVVMFFLGFRGYFFLAVVLGVLIYVRHLGNIERLKAGTETKIGEKVSS